MELSACPCAARNSLTTSASICASESRRTRIDRVAKQVELESGASEAYDHLILATGARAPCARRASIWKASSPCAPSATRRDRGGLATARRVVVIGAGFIGLEIAATARALGGEVGRGNRRPADGPRHLAGDVGVLSRSAQGVWRPVPLGVGVAALHGANGWVSEVELGRPPPARRPRHRRRRRHRRGRAGAEAGLDCADGVVIDAELVTSDPAISAIGDCALPDASASAPSATRSIQNATDQAHCVARRLVGKPTSTLRCLVLERSR